MNIAVIFAGGVGARMGISDIPKQFMEVMGKPIIISTVEKFECNINIDAIILVCVASHIRYCEELIEKFNITKVVKIIPGGKTAQESILFGLRAAKLISKSDESIVLIHDGVRPLITSKLIDDNISSVKKYGNGITCVHSNETIIISKDEGIVSEAIDREKSLVARAPQSFFLNDILNVQEQARIDGKSAVDSCSLMKMYGYRLHIVMGEVDNIKITTRQDYLTLCAVMKAKKDEM